MVSGNDFDKNPDLVIAAIWHTSVLMCENLRRLAILSRDYPHLTPGAP